MKKTIHIHDHNFELFVSASEIEKRCTEIAEEINALNVSKPVIISVLHGAFMFTADVCKQLKNLPEIHFVKISSYTGMKSNAAPVFDLELKTDIAEREVFIFEDIVDSGETIRAMHNYCVERGAKNIRIVSLLLKPNAYKLSLPINYVGFEIPNDFVVGCGLDYNNVGRNLPDLYKAKN